MKDAEQLKKVEQLLKHIVSYLKLVIDHKSSLDKKYLLKAKELKEHFAIAKAAHKNLAKGSQEADDPSKAIIEELEGVLSNFEVKNKKLQKGIETSPAPQLPQGKDFLKNF